MQIPHPPWRCESNGLIHAYLASDIDKSRHSPNSAYPRTSHCILRRLCTPSDCLEVMSVHDVWLGLWLGLELGLVTWTLVLVLTVLYYVSPSLSLRVDGLWSEVVELDALRRHGDDGILSLPVSATLYAHGGHGHGQGWVGESMRYLI